MCCPNYIELCTKLPLNLGHLSIQESQLASMVSKAKGLVERFNQTLTDALVKKYHDNQHFWDQHIREVASASAL